VAAISQVFSCICRFFLFLRWCWVAVLRFCPGQVARLDHDGGIVAVIAWFLVGTAFIAIVAG